MSPVAGIVGLGLIGGSAALGLRAAGWRVWGHDPDPPVVGFEVVDDLARAPRETDVVLVAAPPAVTVGVVEAVARALPDALVTDAASVKRPLAALPAALQARVLPGHPLAGREAGGFAAADGALFAGATWAACPLPGTPITALPGLAELAGALGAALLVCTPEDHDAAVARTSHFPHALAAALAAAAGDPLAGALSGGALRDATRVAAAPADLWWEILRANGDALEAAARDVVARADALVAAAREGDRGAFEAAWRAGAAAQAAVLARRWSPATWIPVGSPVAEGWAPWLALGRDGRAVRAVTLAGDVLRGEAASPET